MPEALSAALETPGLAWLLLTISVAGLVRGFTGFGTAMIFVPIGAQFLPTADVVFLMATTGVFSTAALFPSAWKQADKSEVGALAMAAGITVPIGIWMMMQLDGLVLRWLVSVVIGVTLVVVITGWRWQGKIGWPGRFAIGGAAGTVGGMTGLTGPVVIVFYLANVRDVSRVRANTIVFLAALDVVIVTNLVFGGFAGMETLMVALMLSLPYLITTLIGKALFDPKLEKIYRVASYSVIGLAVLTSLPLFD
ncbi:sulfite exporter TauE/SafE family protein [Parasedimentitalea marina]|uniref:Probable membrane transporter protein n=1 Tax=Parasedimentitalea marina TaxID=2483033 RepID=A0A3T0N541_9RHOB|nr:sulfite exporter TauE/SafE family protein [Parasedimentitalea marina]AZV79089.1 sulfite exporter TauE/SafE family protein [Parasedimentitalea marina]